MAQEIKSFKCHPDYEQAKIEFCQKIDWKFDCLLARVDEL